MTSYDLEIIRVALVNFYNNSLEQEDNRYKSLYELDHIEDVLQEIHDLEARLSINNNAEINFEIKKE